MAQIAKPVVLVIRLSLISGWFAVSAWLFTLTSTAPLASGPGGFKVAESNFPDPRSLNALIYNYQIRRTTGSGPDRINCLMLIKNSETSGRGWPLPHMFEVDYGCPGTYATWTPFAAATDLALYVAVPLGAILTSASGPGVLTNIEPCQNRDSANAVNSPNIQITHQNVKSETLS